MAYMAVSGREITCRRAGLAVGQPGACQPVSHFGPQRGDAHKPIISWTALALRGFRAGGPSGAGQGGKRNPAAGFGHFRARITLVPTESPRKRPREIAPAAAFAPRRRMLDPRYISTSASILRSYRTSRRYCAASEPPGSSSRSATAGIKDVTLCSGRVVEILDADQLHVRICSGYFE